MINLKQIRYGILALGLLSITHLSYAQDDKNELSFDTLRQLAELGDANAEYTLAEKYRIGVELPKDEKLALQGHQKAAAQGNIKAIDAIGIIYHNAKNGSEAVKWYEKAANMGSVDDQETLGSMYRYGKEPRDVGINKDINKAIYWYKRAASQGSTNAFFTLGTIYDDEKNYAEAVKWYEKAANQGHAISMNSLGYAYEIGQGVPKDINKAKNYYKRACLYEIRWGCENLERLEYPQSGDSDK